MNLGLFVINNIFILFRSPQKLEDFNEYLNTKYANIKFTNEDGVDRSIPFLDLLISWNNKNFTATVYRKCTFSGFWSFFDNFIADEYKHRLILNLPFLNIFEKCLLFWFSLRSTFFKRCINFFPYFFSCYMD